MFKAIFVAPAYHQAHYWAGQWGFGNHEWSFIPSTGEDWHPGVYGWWQPEIPVFVCGDVSPGVEMWDEMRARGFTVYDAEDLQTVSI